MGPPVQIHLEEGASDTQSLVLLNPLTIDGLSARRARAPKLMAGVAAWTSSDLFKSACSGKPKAKRWDHFISAESKARRPGILKGAATYLKTPGIISLGGGLPCSEYFPFDELSVKVPAAPHFSERETKDSGLLVSSGKYDVSEGLAAYDLSIALNYGQGTGSAQLLRFITEHTELVCDPPYDDWQCVLTQGNTDALEKAYRIFTERGDYILMEEFTFTSAAETAYPLGLHVLGVKMDSEGLIPEAMDEMLSNWDVEFRGARKPHLLYTIPSGQNPTGATQGLERRKAIYKVAQKHDICILEDDPYYFLQMQPYTGANSPDVAPPASNEEFLKALVPTLLSMDVDGRVMRMDSLSKTIAPGIRTGWITASEQIVERFIRHNETSTQNPNGFSQIILYKLLDDTWGHAGFLQWLLYLRLEYTKRRDSILAACEKFLPQGVVSWNPPAAGMFLWIEVDWKKHPDAKTKDILAIEEGIFFDTMEKGCLVSRGSWFVCEKGFVPTRMFFRATFAAAAPEDMTQAIERFGVAIRQSFKIK